MSTESVQEIIGKAVQDSEYRDLLFTDPEKALEGYELTEEEIIALKDIKAEKFDELLTDIEERISRAGLNVVSKPAPAVVVGKSNDIFNEVVKNILGK